MHDRERNLSVRAVEKNGSLPPRDAIANGFAKGGAVASTALTEPALGRGEPLADDVIEEEIETRVHRTTIVPMPLDNNLPMRGFHDDLELDEPDLFDSEFDDPTSIAHSDRFHRDQPDSAIAQRHSTGPLVTSTRKRSAPPPLETTMAKFGPRLSSSYSDHPGAEHHGSDKWYLRVQLDTDCVADLWIRDLTPHNVLVWSKDMESWVPLLTVRELRDAIRDAHDAKTREELNEANFVFVNTQAKGIGPKPLPEPRLPSSLAAPVAARPTSHWSQPKPRTISNVPPPLLTTAVPVVATGQPSLAPPRVPQIHPAQQRVARSSVVLPPLALPRASQPPSVSQPPSALVLPPLAPHRSLHSPVASPPHTPPSQLATFSSTVPPVVTSIASDQESEPEVEYLPSIPRPARMPVVHRSGSQPPPPPRHQAQLVQYASVGSVIQTRLRPLRELLSAPPIMHVERALWLAAGVAVASAIMLLMRDGEVVASQSLLQAAAPRLGQTTEVRETSRDVTSAVSASVAGRTASGSDVHSVSDLPVVAAHDSASASASSGVKGQRAAKSHAKFGSGAVAPAPITLAVAGNAAASGAFDTPMARRVLTSSASRAGRCASEGPASGSVVVTFAPTGFVQSASVSGLSGQGVNVGCVVRAFQEARVTPFGGAPVTVRKGFQIL